MSEVSKAERRQMALTMLRSGLADIAEVSERMGMSLDSVRRLADSNGLSVVANNEKQVTGSAWRG